MEIKESWDDGWQDDDDAYDDDAYDDSDDDAEVVGCPECGADVYEDAERCPTCGEYIVHSSADYVWSSRPAWWIVLGALGILAVIVALAFGP